MNLDEPNPTSPLNEIAEPLVALAVARAMRPRFVNYRDCIILADRFDQSNFEQWWNQFEGDRTKIEGMLNHVHLWDLLCLVNTDDETKFDGEISEFGKLLADSWRAVLRDEFPTKDFDVTISDTPEDYGPIITFHSRRG